MRVREGDRGRGGFYIIAATLNKPRQSSAPMGRTHRTEDGRGAGRKKLGEIIDTACFCRATDVGFPALAGVP